MMQWIISVALLVAAVLQLAVDRAPDIHDPPIKARARRVKIAALTVVAGYFAWTAWLGGTAHPVLGLGLLLGALGECMFSVNRLFPGLNSSLRADQP